MVLRILFLLFLLPAVTFASGEVVINEVAWMGTTTSANDEWIELKNTTSQSIDVTGWRLEALDGSPYITLSGVMPGQGYFLLERTDDTSAPNVAANQIYTGALSNGGEILMLKNANGAEVDRVNAQDGWPAGDNATKETMHRAGSSWITATPTPQGSGSSPPPPQPAPPPPPLPASSEPEPVNTPSPEPAPETQPVQPEKIEEVVQETQIVQEASVQPTPLRTVVVTYPQSIFISEFLPDPEGSDSEGEWIELYNDADKEVSIGGFSIDDQEGGSRPYRIPDGTRMQAHGFLLLKRAETKIALNNNGDEVRLFYPNGSVAALVSYGDTSEGQSATFDIEGQRLVWTSKLSPGETNTLSTNVKAISSNEQTAPYQQGEVKNIEDLQDLSLEELGMEEDNLAASSKQAGSFDGFGMLLLALFLGVGATFGYLKFVRKGTLGILLVITLLAIPAFGFAETFNVIPELHEERNSQIEAQGLVSGTHSIFYVENGTSISLSILQNLSDEFNNWIFPRLTSHLGHPWTPGIDNDSRITVLFTKLISGVGGYFNAEDEFSKGERASSNEREMVYISADFVENPKIRAFLAHEFGHLITFNQKIKNIGRDEEPWINEVRSEFVPTFLGYDDNFQGSNLQERMIHFSQQPHDQLISWNSTKYDYGAVNMFAQYLRARFGDIFFKEEIRVAETGVASIEETFRRLNIPLTFAEFFAEWRLTNYVNDTGILNGKYSYKNNDIGIKLAPELNLSLVSSQPTVESFVNIIPSFSGKAVHVILNENDARIHVSSPHLSSDLMVTYIEEWENGAFSEGQFSLEQGKGEFYVDKGTRRVTLMLSSVSQDIALATFHVRLETQATSEPAITSIESVFVKPTPERNVFFIKGKDFDKNASLLFNGETQEFTYQDASTLITRVHPWQGGIIAIKLINPGGSEGIYTWQNPLGDSVENISSSNTFEVVFDGSLVRLIGDSAIFVVQGNVKRHIMDARIFSFYGHLANAPIQDVAQDTLNSYQTSTLIRFFGSPKVYEILPDGRRLWIPTVQEFIERGFNWDEVFEINEQELNFYSDV